MPQFRAWHGTPVNVVGAISRQQATLQEIANAQGAFAES